MSIATAPVAWAVSSILSVLRSTDAMTPAPDLLIRVITSDSESVVVLYEIETPLIFRTPAVVEFNPEIPAVSRVLTIRATPRLVVPAMVGLVVAMDALALAMPSMPRALLESPAALNEREWPSNAPVMLSWSLLPTTEKAAVAPVSAGEPPARN